MTIKLQYILEQKIPFNETQRTFVINKGDSLYKVLDRLEESHGIEGTSWLRLRYIFRESPVIKAGRYTIHRDSKLGTLIDRFEAAEEFENRSGVKEGVGFVALFQIVVRDHRVEVMNVMKPDVA